MQRPSSLFTSTAGDGCTGGLGYQRRAGVFLQWLSPSSSSMPAAAARAASAASTALVSAFYIGDFAAIAAAQRTCGDTQEVISKSFLKIKFFPMTGKDLACDVSQVTARPVVPVSFRQQVFSSIHNIAHPGIRASKRLISARFVWRKMGSQIAEMCRTARAVPEVRRQQQYTLRSSLSRCQRGGPPTYTLTSWGFY